MAVSLQKDDKLVRAVLTCKVLGDIWGHMHGRRSVPMRWLRGSVELNFYVPGKGSRHPLIVVR